MPTHVQDTEAVRAVVQLYIDGARSGDTSLFERAFHPDAQMYGSFNGEPMNMPISRFIEMAKSFPPPATSGEPYEATISAISVTGDAAVATLQETSFLGADFVDYFALLRTDGAWQIVNKTFHQLR